jgi:hypothetical protein
MKDVMRDELGAPKIDPPGPRPQANHGGCRRLFSAKVGDKDYRANQREENPRETVEISFEGSTARWCCARHSQAC